MAKMTTTFWKFPTDLITYPEVQILLAEKGEGALLQYIIMKSQMLEYERYDFAIPEKCLKLMAALLQTTEDKIRDTVVYCVGQGFFQVEEDENGEKRIYADDIRTAGREIALSRKAMSEAGIRGNKKRWNKKENN